eukprot:TRINITY_DN2706_c0_g1_i8.p1 TRINITY_DN2706_c0_g1~~TRINITY_DN2706_c0_g1_i8.p1  ORF type:complete len:321 (+),score=43.84 TRINITY_DN2706_c0_g1_i8:357-1319(+)
MIRRSRVRGFEFPLIAPQVVTWSVYLIVVGATYSLLLTTDVLSTKRLDLIVSIYSGMVGILAILFVWIETADPANCSVSALMLPCPTAGSKFEIYCGFQLPLDESGLLQSLQERYPERCQFCSEHQGPRTKHCGHCNKCIHDFDHHCLYLNTCIGAANYHLFVGLVTVSVILLFGQSALLIYIAVKEETILSFRTLALTVVCIMSVVVGSVLLSLISAHAYLRFWLNQTTFEFLRARKARHQAARRDSSPMLPVPTVFPVEDPLPAELDRPGTPSGLGEASCRSQRMSQDVLLAGSPDEMFDVRASSFFGVSIPEEDYYN